MNKLLATLLGATFGVVTLGASAQTTPAPATTAPVPAVQASAPAATTTAAAPVKKAGKAKHHKLKRSAKAVNPAK